MRTQVELGPTHKHLGIYLCSCSLVQVEAHGQGCVEKAGTAAARGVMTLYSDGGEGYDLDGMQAGPPHEFSLLLRNCFLRKSQGEMCTALCTPALWIHSRDVLCFVFEQEKPTTMYSGMRTP